LREGGRGSLVGRWREVAMGREAEEYEEERGKAALRLRMPSIEHAWDRAGSRFSFAREGAVSSPAPTVLRESSVNIEPSISSR